MIITGSAGFAAGLHAEVVIVGAGPAGLALTAGLAASGRTVLVLESGSYNAVPDQDAGCAKVIGPLPYFDLSACRPRGLGGSTELWGGWCEPLHDIDFESRPGLRGSGWCITRDDLEISYLKAHKFCGIPPNQPLPRWARASDLKAAGAPFVSYGFPVLGPRQLGHQHAGLFAGDTTDLLLQATVKKVVPTASGESIDRLVASTVLGDVNVSADAFVLAAGGIETARLLLASACPSWPTGLGNAAGLVGCCFMEHPHVDAMRLVADASALDIGFFAEQPGTAPGGQPIAAAGALMLSDEACRAEGVGRAQLFIEPAAMHAAHPIGRVRGDKPFRGRYAPARPQELAVIMVTEQQPDRRSRILLSDERDRHGVPLPVLDWRLSSGDRHTAQVTMGAARDMLAALGARNIRQRMHTGSWPTDTLGGPHHLGTTRMGRSPSTGVVDRDGRVYGIGNLYVTGGSVFPTSGYAPPTLTVVALSFRLADHLLNSPPPSKVRRSVAPRARR